MACFCAAWCDTCEEYKPAAGAVRRPSVHVFAWIDIEDHAELLGDVDVENFPPSWSRSAGGVVFYGPMLPHIGHLERLLDSLDEHKRAGDRGAARPATAAGCLTLLLLRAMPGAFLRAWIASTTLPGGHAAYLRRLQQHGQLALGRGRITVLARRLFFDWGRRRRRSACVWRRSRPSGSARCAARTAIRRAATLAAALARRRTALFAAAVAARDQVGRRACQCGTGA